MVVVLVAAVVVVVALLPVKLSAGIRNQGKSFRVTLISITGEALEEVHAFVRNIILNLSLIHI